MTHTHTQTDAHADTRTPENRTPGNGMSENRPPGNRPSDARPSVTRADDTRTAVNRPAADHPPTDRTVAERSKADRTATERAAADRAAATADPAAVDVTTAGLPAWLDPVAEAARSVRPHQLSRFLPPESGAGRQSAVLVLFGEGARGPELLLMERSGTLRSHAGQPSFPGGALDPEDGDQATTGPLRAALREAEEETGLDPRGVQLFGVLPRLYIPVSSFVVTPVLGWWRAPSPVGVVDPAETARVFTVPVADLTDPANRAMAVHPSGHSGPAFLVESALVWGFTAGVIDRILHYAGWERPWDRARQVPLDWRA